VDLFALIKFKEWVVRIGLSHFN